MPLGNPWQRSWTPDRQPAGAERRSATRAAPATAHAIPPGPRRPGELALYNDAQMSDDPDAAQRMFDLTEARIAQEEHNV
jgi:hypothetical protein